MKTITRRSMIRDAGSDALANSKFNKPRRVTKEMVTAARKAAQKANEEALQARIKGRRVRP